MLFEGDADIDRLILNMSIASINITTTTMNNRIAVTCGLCCCITGVDIDIKRDTDCTDCPEVLTPVEN